ncbi:MAG TPA: MAPEG family protein [Myxococcales bacterium]|nr:MAPEG family protein [Myxococcales bacterium]
MLLHVTILYGTLLCLVTLLLALNISLYRLYKGIFIGMEVPKQLHRFIRAHGNSAEWLAAVVLPLAFLELQGAPSFWLHLAGGSLLATRVLHAAFLLTGLRVAGLFASTISATLMYLAAFGTAIGALWLRLR